MKHSTIIAVALLLAACASQERIDRFARLCDQGDMEACQLELQYRQDRSDRRAAALQNYYRSMQRPTVRCRWVGLTWTCR